MDTDHPRPGDALLIVDVQNDFLPGGALPVCGGDQVIPSLNAAIARFRAHGLPVYATRDWHPANHCSFRPNRGVLPPHAIEDTPGAAFPAALALPPETKIVSKGTMMERDAYSGFEDTALAAMLRAEGIVRLFVGGLATDYCVLNTVSDALDHGFEVILLPDAMCAVELQPGDAQAAIDTMCERGAFLAAGDGRVRRTGNRAASASRTQYLRQPDHEQPGR